MRREQKKFDQGDGVFKLVNRVFSDPVLPNGVDAHVVKLQFVKILADTQDILRCGGSEYETLRIFFDGTHWVAESQAIVNGN